MMGGCLGKKVPGSRQRKRLPKAARGGAGPGEPGSSIASYGKRWVESTRAGVAEGTVGVGAFPPLSREALRNARVAMVTGHVPRGRGRGVRGGKGRARGRQRNEKKASCNNELACKTHAAAILDPMAIGPTEPIRGRLHDLHAPAPPS